MKGLKQWLPSLTGKNPPHSEGPATILILSAAKVMA